MLTKWGVLLPLVVCVSLTGYYLSTEPQQTELVPEAVLTQLSAPLSVAPSAPEEDIPESGDAEPLEQIQPEEPAVSESPVTEEVPEEMEDTLDSEEETDLEEALEEEAELLEEIPDEEMAEPQEEADLEEATEEEPVETAVIQQLEYDVYQLAGSYTSDQGIPVEIKFVDGYYHISLQGLSDIHRTIVENLPPSGNTLDLTIALTSLPISLDLGRTEGGTLSVVAYMEGSSTPLLSATATRDDTA